MMIAKFNEVELIYKNPLKASQRPHITCSKDAYNILVENWSPQIGMLEEFNLLLLDRSNRVLCISRLSKGGISSTVVDLKIAFATALKGRASNLILAHNHPSGNLKPSEADISITKRFKEAGKLLDIKIFDHIILSPDGEYYSFSDEGCIL